ncbi:conserved protein of unknown function [Nitrospira japonica]|uniref:Uncharacterized protein n=1 Tax=Nitrospira japonica TaxID=1325564 RepID=A0A1W1I9G4_9BACT|nr:conserved protein of unknown function [Nitrospira japonica]
MSLGRSRKVGVRNVDTHLVPEVPNHLREACACDAGQKGEDVAAGSAAEAMKNLPGGTDSEGGSLFLMKGTQPFQILTASDQAHVLPDNLRDVDPVPDLIDDVFRNQASAHGSRGSSFPPQAGGSFERK